MATIQGIYIALFGRPADPLGLGFFNSATNNGADLTAIGDLASTAEYQNRFAGQNNTQIVSSIFQSLYNRVPDQAGLNFFVNALINKTFTINNIAIAIFDGAQGADLVLRNLKESAANAFTAAIDTQAEINGYNGTAAAVSAVGFLSSVTITAPTAAQVNAAVLAAVTPPSLTITMTSQIGEQINGTNANETISAVLNAAAPGAATGTFNTGDTVNGGGGTDTINITVTSGGAILPPGATISNVEIVNINQSAASATGIVASAFVGVQQLWQIDTIAAGGTFQDVNGLGAGVTAGFRGNAQVVNNFAVVATGVDTLNVALDGVLSGSAVGAGEATANSLKTVNVTGSLAAAGTFAMGGLGAATETYNYSLSSNTSVSINPVGATALANVKTVDFSGSTGNITFNSSAYTNAFITLNGGSGNDTLTASNAVANATTLTVNGGSGADTINFVNTKSAIAGASVLIGGAGADKFVFTGGSNLVAVGSNANLLASLTSIADFSAAEDSLTITGMALGARVAQNVVNGASVGADLLAVTTAVAGVTAVGQHAFFQFGSDTYLYGNIAGAGLTTTDALIQLTGVSVGSLTAANLIV